MKQPKKLTYEQKKCVSAHRMNPKKWSLVKETDFYLFLINKETKDRKIVDKFVR